MHNEHIELLQDRHTKHIISNLDSFLRGISDIVGMTVSDKKLFIYSNNRMYISEDFNDGYTFYHRIDKTVTLFVYDTVKTSIKINDPLMDNILVQTLCADEYIKFVLDNNVRGLFGNFRNIMLYASDAPAHTRNSICSTVYHNIKLVECIHIILSHIHSPMAQPAPRSFKVHGQFCDIQRCKQKLMKQYLLSENTISIDIDKRDHFLLQIGDEKEEVRRKLGLFDIKIGYTRILLRNKEAIKYLYRLLEDIQETFPVNKDILTLAASCVLGEHPFPFEVIFLLQGIFPKDPLLKLLTRLKQLTYIEKTLIMDKNITDFGEYKQIPNQRLMYSPKFYPSKLEREFLKVLKLPKDAVYDDIYKHINTIPSIFEGANYTRELNKWLVDYYRYVESIVDSNKDILYIGASTIIYRIQD